jgi:hypothetical protein
MGITNVTFDATCQILYSSYTSERKGINERVRHVFIDFKKAYYSVRMEVLYNILIEFSITMKPVRIIKMCLNEIYSRVWVEKHISDMFPIQNRLKHALSPLRFFFALKYAIRMVQVN